ncbi:hypothetical protein N9470_02605 [Emcibacteraceae bacterium]|nr:hypothetical protein [Emcibacteraceae bacterium]
MKRYKLNEVNEKEQLQKEARVRERYKKEKNFLFGALIIIVCGSLYFHFHDYNYRNYKITSSSLSGSNLLNTAFGMTVHPYCLMELAENTNIAIKDCQNVLPYSSITSEDEVEVPKYFNGSTYIWRYWYSLDAIGENGHLLIREVETAGGSGFQMNYIVVKPQRDTDGNLVALNKLCKHHLQFDPQDVKAYYKNGIFKVESQSSDPWEVDLMDPSSCQSNLLPIL